MAEKEFSVSYDGPALETGRMAVRDLAPALLALGDLFADASLLVYPNRAPVALNIKANERGSFVVQLIVEAHRSWDDLIDMFGGSTASALANLEAIIIGGGGSAIGLIALIKRLKGRRIVKQEPAEPGQIALTLDDDTTFRVSASALSMYGSVEIRKRVRQVVVPLSREGIESLRFKADVPTVEIDKGDVDAFELPDAEESEVLLDQEREMVVEIVAVAFVESNKWRFSDGQQTFYAAVEDEAYLRRIDSCAEAFRKGDMLRCRMRIVQTRRLDDGLHTEYLVIKVIEHIPRQTQLTLGGGE